MSGELYVMTSNDLDHLMDDALALCQTSKWLKGGGGGGGGGEQVRKKKNAETSCEYIT